MTNPTPHGQVPEAMRLADMIERYNAGVMSQKIAEDYIEAAAELRRLHAYCQELEAQVIRDCMTHVQKPAEIEHVAGDVSKNGAEVNMNVYAELPQSVGDHKYGGGLYTDAQMLAFADATHALRTQQPCPTCAALARTVMLDQVSFDRKPDCYGIRQITDDEGVEEWEDIRTSPDVAREEADDMMATGRGELYEVVPLWTTPQPSPTEQAAECVPSGPSRKDMLWSTVKMQERHDQRIENIVSGLERIKQEHAGQQPQKIDECYGDCPTDSTTCTNPCRFDGRAARATADSVLEDAARLTTEQEYAIRQGHEIAASEAYFGARSKLDTNRNHNIFTAGFERGWDAARKQGVKP